MCRAMEEMVADFVIDDRKETALRLLKQGVLSYWFKKQCQIKMMNELYIITKLYKIIIEEKQGVYYGKQKNLSITYP